MQAWDARQWHARRTHEGELLQEKVKVWWGA
jgi:hypothetical protein